MRSRVAESVVTLLRRNEPSKDLVSQSLSSKLTCEREMAQKALELLLTAQNAFEREREISSQGSWPLAHSSQRVRERERSAHKALELLLTAQSAFERERSAHNAKAGPKNIQYIDYGKYQQQTFLLYCTLQGAISCCCIWESFAGISCDYKRKAGWPQILIKQC